MTEALQELANELESAQTVLVIQAENVDGDSLASSIALEYLLSTDTREIIMYCPVAMPRHLRYLEGWDRVVGELPQLFDLSVVVDTSSQLLMERVFSQKQLPILRSRPMFTIDHHATEVDMPFQTYDILEKDSVSTGEVLYNIAKELHWEIPRQAAEMIVSSILSDSLGLTTPSTTGKSIAVVADLVQQGVKIYELDAKRREAGKRLPEITHYKGQLLQRIEYNLDGALATADISWEEIQEYSDKYNPAVLVIDEMRMTTGVHVAIAYKNYPDGKILAKIRTNLEAPIANLIAQNFGSDGHAHAAGFKLRDRNFEDVKAEVITITEKLLKEVSK